MLWKNNTDPAGPFADCKPFWVIMFFSCSFENWYFNLLDVVRRQKRLFNHKMNNGVTVGYILKDVEWLRKPMQQLANFILEHMMETADIS